FFGPFCGTSTLWIAGSTTTKGGPDIGPLCPRRNQWKNSDQANTHFHIGQDKIFQSILDLSRNMIEAIDESVAEQKDIDIKQFQRYRSRVPEDGTENLRSWQFIAQARTSILAVNLPQLALKLGVSTHEKEVSQFFYQVVEKTIKYREDNNYTRPDFLQLLINIRNDSKDSEHPFTMDQLVAQVSVFFIAGFDTSSSAMNFAIYELCKNPTIQEKVREEIRDVLKKHGGQLTYEDLAEMKYM
ncbi:hypothetical protein NQ315_017027, partial [Exocentrus adspersus]